MHPVKIIVSIIVGVIVIALWIFLAPAKLGGSTNYSITSGISMEPMFHKNDLALVRAQSSYHVGDIVLYQSRVVHAPVLHRIFLIQNGNYFFKGDNNSFVDPGYATPAELTGKLWLHIPRVGAVLGWFGKPSHAAIIAAATTVALIVPGFTTASGRRRGRRAAHKMRIFVAGQLNRPAKAASTVDRHSIEMTPWQQTSHYISSFLEGPLVTLTAFVIVTLLALLLLLVGYSHPAKQTAPLANAYNSSGTFSYSAIPKTPTAVYPSGFLITGDPIYPSLIDTVTITFKYRLLSSLPHNIKGTIGLDTLLLSSNNTWKNLSVVSKAIPFTGDTTALSEHLKLSDLYGFIDSISTQSGVVMSNYSADIQPVVHITGDVNGQFIDETFKPVLPFNITSSIITLNDVVTPPLPGATYTLPSADANRISTLNPIQSSSITHLAPNTILIAKYRVSVSLIRLMGLVLGIIAVVLAIIHDKLRQGQKIQTNEELLAKQFRLLIVPVTSLPLPPDAVEIDVPELARFVELAQYLERPIFYVLSPENKIYCIDDDGHRYVYHSSNESIAGSVSAQQAAATTSVRSKQTINISLTPPKKWFTITVRVVSGFIVLAVFATIATSLTASINVPTSRVSKSAYARQIAQLAPAGCSALTLNSLVMATGTSSNKLSNVLILGNAGINTLTDTGTGNCIVGGGGVDKITAPASDICIKGPTTGSTYGSCTVKLL